MDDARANITTAIIVGAAAAYMAWHVCTAHATPLAGVTDALYKEQMMATIEPPLAGFKEYEAELFQLPGLLEKLTAEPEPGYIYSSRQTLNSYDGVFYGPSGKESYYNLDMSYVVELMQAAGYDLRYWIRKDGVKMYGDYVMVAADLSIRPKGTILNTSLGKAIVCDTGYFIYNDRYALDVAVAW